MIPLLQKIVLFHYAVPNIIYRFVTLQINPIKLMGSVLQQ